MDKIRGGGHRAGVGEADAGKEVISDGRTGGSRWEL